MRVLDAKQAYMQNVTMKNLKKYLLITSVMHVNLLYFYFHFCFPSLFFCCFAFNNTKQKFSLLVNLRLYYNIYNDYYISNVYKKNSGIKEE